jgi:integrase
MFNQAIIDLAQYRKKKEPKQKTTRGKKGTIYSRSGKLWVDFRYLNERVREPSGLSDSKGNQSLLRKQLDLIIAEIENGVFNFAQRFPHSSKREYFSELEGQRVTKNPGDVLFGEYVKKWFEAMQPGMSRSQIRDYTSALDMHLLPYFRKLTFGQINTVQLKKFVAQMKGKKNSKGNPLSAKRIQNVMIPLRVIIKDAIEEFGWQDFPDPFTRLKLPRPKKFRVLPFSFDEWKILIDAIPNWYRPYFEFAVQTGLRPSEQVALKWDAIDNEYIHIELSRVRNFEKDDLKTHESRRRILLRPTLRGILEWQKKLSQKFESPYVFVNSYGRPILQDKLRELWTKVMQKTKLPYRRMYETRHTFASWALALGETPEWVARTLGHVDTSMVYKTYGRYIPNLTKLDGSAIERQFAASENRKGSEFGHNFGHNRDFTGCQSAITT